ncbi:MAG: polysaccharide deacetylase family protein, partial [Clostridia bacterium]|nr:polysaccharide deacetylase family protein [Clostridia bacterium]
MQRKDKVFINIIANIVIIAVIALLLTGTFLSNGAIPAAVGNKAIYQGNPELPRVTLMFNVYWGTEYIVPILDILDNYGVKTTFFIGGSWAAKNNDLLKEINNRGHELGNHGYLHLDHGKLSETRNKEEIELTGKLLYKVTGVQPNLFAPPSGALGQNMFRACEKLDYTVIMWSRDTIDWRDKDSSLVYKRATNGIQNGDLVLMHPTPHTLAALPSILEFYKVKGLT